MGQQYPYPTRWVKQIVSIITIYVDIGLILSSYYNKDTEYESLEMEICVAGPIFCHKSI